MHRGLLVQRASRPPPCGSFPPPCAPLGPLVRRTTLVVQGEPSLGGPKPCTPVVQSSAGAVSRCFGQRQDGAQCTRNACARRPWCKAPQGGCTRTHGAIVQHLCKAALVQSATRAQHLHTGLSCNTCARRPWCKAPRGCCARTQGRRAMHVQGSSGAKCYKGAAFVHRAIVQHLCKAAMVQSTTRMLWLHMGPSCNTRARQPWCKVPQGSCARAQGCCAMLVRGGPGAKHHEGTTLAHGAIVQHLCKAALVQSATRGLCSHTGPLCNACARRPWCKAPRGCCAHT